MVKGKKYNIPLRNKKTRRQVLRVLKISSPEISAEDMERFSVEWDRIMKSTRTIVPLLVPLETKVEFIETRRTARVFRPISKAQKQAILEKYSSRT